VKVKTSGKERPAAYGSGGELARAEGQLSTLS
jgi:hypothetical protein